MKYTITETPGGRFRVESRFQRIGTFRSREASDRAIALEDERLAFIRARTECTSYGAAMQSVAAAEREWAQGRGGAGVTDLEREMVRALAAIDAALGLPEDGCNSLARTMAEIARLRSLAHGEPQEGEDGNP